MTGSERVSGTEGRGDESVLVCDMLIVFVFVGVCDLGVCFWGDWFALSAQRVLRGEVES